MKLPVVFLFLCVTISGYSQSVNFFVDEILYLSPADIKSNKVRTCTATDSAREGIVASDYFAFDTAGRLIREDIRSLGPDRSDIRTFAYDTVPHGDVLVTEYNTENAEALIPAESGKPEQIDRDSLIRSVEPKKNILYRKSRDIHTTYFNEDGEVESEIYPGFDKNDSIVKVSRYSAGRIREVSVYRADGTLEIDSIFDEFEITVHKLDEHGNETQQETIDIYGEKQVVFTRVYSYDKPGNVLEQTERDGENKVKRHMVYAWDANGVLVKLVITDSIGRIISSSESKTTAENGDTTRTNQYFYYYSGSDRSFYTNWTESWNHLTHTRTAVTTRYVTGPGQKLIGDTSTEISTTIYDEHGRLISSNTIEDGEQTDYWTYKYDNAGHVIEMYAIHDSFVTTQKWSYYPDGTLKETIYDSGHTNTVQYNKEGKPLKIIFGYPAQPEDLVYTMTYGSNGLLLRKVQTERGIVVSAIEYNYTFY